MKLNVKQLRFENLTGNNIAVFYNNTVYGYIYNQGGALSQNISDYLLHPQFFAKEDERKAVLSEFFKRRKSAWRKTVAKMDEGWTQWDPLEVKQWEEVNRERLANALGPFGLQITFKEVKESGSTWFKISKID